MANSVWQVQQGTSNQQGFLDLFANRCGYIEIENFLSPVQCQAVIQELRNLGLKQFEYHFNIDDAPPAASLFETHYLYENKKPEDYFPKAQASIVMYQAMVKRLGYDPVQKVLSYLSQQLQMPVSIAEQDGKQFHTVLARELNHSAMLHADFAPFIPNSHWVISKIMAEYAWNIYLTDPGSGGECVVYNKPWQQEDDRYIIKNTYGYDHAVVADREQVKVKPTPGKLVIFNSRNFHEVLKSQRPRLSIGGHIGLLPEQKCIAWI
jgi:hypothetical protein